MGEWNWNAIEFIVKALCLSAKVSIQQMLIKWKLQMIRNEN